MVRVGEGAGEPPRGRAAPPPEQPAGARQIVEEPGKGQKATQDQDGADQAVELAPGPDQLDHQQIGARVGQEEQECVGRVGRGDGAEDEKDRGQGRRGVERSQRPVHQRTVAEGELDEDEGDQEGERQVEGRAPPRELALGHHPLQPAEQAGQNQELGDRQRPTSIGAGGQGGPQEDGVEAGAAEAVQNVRRGAGNTLAHCWPC